jgi:YD repeat-containing protein
MPEAVYCCQVISAERNSGYLQEWDLDGLGNWSSFDDDGTVQTRVTNVANEITSTTGLATPAYDRAGNMIETPKPGDPANEWEVTYDAWNRVVEVSDGTTTVAYEYDGEGRRIEERQKVRETKGVRNQK